MSERRACRVLHQPRSSHRYERKPSSDEPQLVSRIHELVRQHPRFGYRRITVLLKREGFQAGFDRVYRLWRREGLKVPKTPKKRRRFGVECERLRSSSCGAQEPGLGLHLRPDSEWRELKVAERGRRAHARMLVPEGVSSADQPEHH